MEHQLKYAMTPVVVTKVRTKYRRIVTKLPVPQSLPIFRKLMKYEPISMQGQPPVLWDRAEGCQVDDRTEESEFGKFGWVMDPEGSRIELWEPPSRRIPS